MTDSKGGTYSSSRVWKHLKGLRFLLTLGSCSTIWRLLIWGYKSVAHMRILPHFCYLIHSRDHELLSKLWNFQFQVTTKPRDPAQSKWRPE